MPSRSPPGDSYGSLDSQYSRSIFGLSLCKNRPAATAPPLPPVRCQERREGDRPALLEDLPPPPCRPLACAIQVMRGGGRGRAPEEHATPARPGGLPPP